MAVCSNLCPSIWTGHNYFIFVPLSASLQNGSIPFGCCKDGFNTKLNLNSISLCTPFQVTSQSDINTHMKCFLYRDDLGHNMACTSAFKTIGKRINP